jgi:hypothetical protein
MRSVNMTAEILVEFLVQTQHRLDNELAELRTLLWRPESF